MRAFLLAAGRGTRISKSIPEIPKCTLDIDGKPLIQRTVDMLLAGHVDVTVIVGYKQEVVRRVLEGYPVDIVYNPFFDVTNSIGSLWMAREFFRTEDTIIANADVFWPKEILDTLIKAPFDNVMLADQKHADDGDYFFYEEDGILKRYGKNLKREERNAEYVGIAFLRESFVPDFVQRMNDMVSAQEHGVWWENVLYGFIGQHDIHVMDVGERFWAEIDFIEDYHRIIEYVESRK